MVTVYWQEEMCIPKIKYRNFSLVLGAAAVELVDLLRGIRLYSMERYR